MMLDDISEHAAHLARIKKQSDYAQTSTQQQGQAQVLFATPRRYFPPSPRFPSIHSLFAPFLQVSALKEEADRRFEAKVRAYQKLQQESKDSEKSHG